MVKLICIISSFCLIVILLLNGALAAEKGLMQPSSQRGPGPGSRHQEHKQTCNQGVSRNSTAPGIRQLHCMKAFVTPRAQKSGTADVVHL